MTMMWRSLGSRSRTFSAVARYLELSTRKNSASLWPRMYSICSALLVV